MKTNISIRNAIIALALTIICTFAAFTGTAKGETTTNAPAGTNTSITITVGHRGFGTNILLTVKTKEKGWEYVEYIFSQTEKDGNEAMTLDRIRFWKVGGQFDYDLFETCGRNYQEGPRSDKNISDTEATRRWAQYKEKFKSMGIEFDSNHTLP